MYKNLSNVSVLVLLTDSIEKEMRSLFNIPVERETRLWNKYMSNTYEQLSKPDSTVQDAGLFQGQVRHSKTLLHPRASIMAELANSFWT